MSGAIQWSCAAGTPSFAIAAPAVPRSAAHKTRPNPVLSGGKITGSFRCRRKPCGLPPASDGQKCEDNRDFLFYGHLPVGDRPLRFLRRSRAAKSGARSGRLSERSGFLSLRRTGGIMRRVKVDGLEVRPKFPIFTERHRRVAKTAQALIFCSCCIKAKEERPCSRSCRSGLLSCRDKGGGTFFTSS